jgi:hypothetical protein
MARVLEYMHEVHLGITTIRVWAKTEVFHEQIRDGQRGVLIETVKGLDRRDLPIIAETICAHLDFVTAVEVKRSGQGVLIYPEWP